MLRWLAILLILLSAAVTGGAAALPITRPASSGSYLALQPEDPEIAELPSTGAAMDESATGFLLVLYCAAIVAVSLLGGWLPSRLRINHLQMQTVISFVGGLMLGIGVFHLLPHSIHSTLSVDEAVWWMMAGILAMFLLIRCFHFHHHGPLEISTSTIEPCAGLHDHDHDHDSNTGSRGPQHPAETIPDRSTEVRPPAPPGNPPPHCHHAHQLSWLGIAVGLSLHTMIDGLALAASVESESRHPMHLPLFGLGTFLAILLHKPLDAVSISSLMVGSGWSARSRVLVNLGFSMMCPLGALLFFLGVRQLSTVQDMVISAALAFSAGVFLCISLSDLLPEMEFHAHNRVQLTMALLGGILLSYGITFLEPAHLHGSPDPSNAAALNEPASDSPP